jgi:hypothetical protein
VIESSGKGRLPSGRARSKAWARGRPGTLEVSDKPFTPKGYGEGRMWCPQCKKVEEAVKGHRTPVCLPCLVKMGWKCTGSQVEEVHAQIDKQWKARQRARNRQLREQKRNITNPVKVFNLDRYGAGSYVKSKRLVDQSVDDHN